MSSNFIVTEWQCHTSSTSVIVFQNSLSTFCSPLFPWFLPSSLSTPLPRFLPNTCWGGFADYHEKGESDKSNEKKATQPPVRKVSRPARLCFGTTATSVSTFRVFAPKQAFLRPLILSLGGKQFLGFFRILKFFLFCRVVLAFWRYKALRLPCKTHV